MKMKKVLLGAGLVVLATSCTQDEFSSLATQKEDVRGISFELSEAPQSRILWSEEDGKLKPTWFAEMDRVAISHAGVREGYSAGVWTNKWGKNKPVYWKDLSSDSVVYKATQSAKSGKFTSVDDENMLGFAEDTIANFFAVYPVDVATSVKGGYVALTKLPAINEQTQEGLNGFNPAIVAYAKATASREESYSAVGETVGLEYQFPLAAIRLATKNADTYTVGKESMFGKLVSIELLAKGYDADGKGYDTSKGDIMPSIISFNGTGKDSIKVDTLTWKSTLVLDKTTTTNDSNKVVLAINQEWNDKALALAAVAPVKRTDVYKDGKKETFEVKYNFENIELTHPTTTVSIDFSAGAFLNFPALDVEAFDYLVTKESAFDENDRTLIVNDGTLAGIIKDKKVIWPAGSDETIDPTEFANIYINNIALTADETKLLSLFTNAKVVVLEETTALAEGTFTDVQAQGIDSINMPKVTKIDPKFIVNSEEGTTDNVKQAFKVLQGLILPAYTFEDATVNAAFFNSDTKSKLFTLDMSGVANMLPSFGIDRSLTFEGYALKTVTVQNGMKVSPNGFAKCASLAAINGVVDLINGDNAFAECTSLKTININGTVIPYKAFYNCSALENIYNGGKQVVPTKVKESGLELTGIKYMDLSALTEIGKYAFKSSALCAPEEGEDVITIAGKLIAEEAFASTKIVMVKFTEAEKLENNILSGVESLKHLKFSKVFTVDETATNAYGAEMFGKYPGKIDLFINPDQDYMSGTIMTLKSKDAETPYTFKTVQREN